MIYPIAKCQSERNMPKLNPFKNGISSVKSLKGTERFDRFFCSMAGAHESSFNMKTIPIQKNGSR